MRFPALMVSVFLTAVPSLSAADRIVEFGLVVCQQQEFADPVVTVSSIQSSELIVPVASLDLPPEDLPSDEGRACASVLSDLTRDGYKLLAATPILRRSPSPEENFLLRRQAVVERLEWTIRLATSIALLSCEPLVDKVARFSDGADPSPYSVPIGASCAVHLAAILVQGGQIIDRHAVAPASSVSPSGAVSIYTAYELIRTFGEEGAARPRLPRANLGRDR